MAPHDSEFNSNSPAQLAHVAFCLAVTGRISSLEQYLESEKTRSLLEQFKKVSETAVLRETLDTLKAAFLTSKLELDTPRGSVVEYINAHRPSLYQAYFEALEQLSTAASVSARQVQGTLKEDMASRKLLRCTGITEAHQILLEFFDNHFSVH